MDSNTPIQMAIRHPPRMVKEVDNIPHPQDKHLQAQLHFSQASLLQKWQQLQDTEGENNLWTSSQYPLLGLGHSKPVSQPILRT